MNFGNTYSKGLEVYLMRETLRDWKRDWIETNGETDDIEVF